MKDRVNKAKEESSFSEKFWNEIAMETPRPGIKGVFVNSHVARVRKEKGQAGIEELKKIYSDRLKFGYLEDVPLKEEIKIIEAAMTVLEGKDSSDAGFAFEAGRFHFRNFAQTSYGKIVLSLLPKGMKETLKNSTQFSNYIFTNLGLKAIDRGDNTMVVIMDNADYPLDHFKGFFFEWMEQWKLNGEVHARALTDHTYEYKLVWE